VTAVLINQSIFICIRQAHIQTPTHTHSQNTTTIYRVAQKKSKPQSFVDTFAKYRPIFKIFWLLHSVKNL